MLTINNRFPGWRFVDIDQNIQKFYKPRTAPNRLDLIEGDFDENGQKDYALYIIYGKTPNRKSGVVAVMRKNTGLELRLLEEDPIESDPVSSDSYLLLERKGTQGYDHEAARKFRYTKDAITFVIMQKASVSYLYEKGKFRRIITGD